MPSGITINIIARIFEVFAVEVFARFINKILANFMNIIQDSNFPKSDIERALTVDLEVATIPETCKHVAGVDKVKVPSL